MLSYEILDGFIFVLVWFNCWVHILILCFLGFAICVLCHRSCLHARVVGGHSSMTFFLFLFFSLRSLLVIASLFSSPLHCYLGPYSLLSLSRVFFLAAFLADVFRTSVRSVNSDRGVIVYCLLRQSLGCLNWLVYMALPGEVSIAGRRAIVYCLLRRSLGCLNRLVYMALLGEVSIG